MRKRRRYKHLMDDLKVKRKYRNLREKTLIRTFLENSLCKSLWTCYKTDYPVNDGEKQSCLEYVQQETRLDESYPDLFSFISSFLQIIDDVLFDTHVRY